MDEYIIRDKNNNSAAVIPEKGGSVVSFCINGREYLYRDQDNLDSDERSRCGILFLFPAFGRFPDEKFVWQGNEYRMGIHGFGHTSKWDVKSESGNSLDLELRSDDVTRASYPFDFKVDLHFEINDGVLSIRQTYENTGTEPMPYSFGFHPYWIVDDLGQAIVEACVAGDHGIDRITGKVSVLEGHDEAGASIDNVVDEAVLSVGGGKKVRCRFDRSFTRIVLWTKKNSGFLCVEPINGVPNGLAAHDCYFLEPNYKCEACVSFDIID